METIKREIMKLKFPQMWLFILMLLFTTNCTSVQKLPSQRKAYLKTVVNSSMFRNSLPLYDGSLFLFPEIEWDKENKIIVTPARDLLDYLISQETCLSRSVIRDIKNRIVRSNGVLKMDSIDFTCLSFYAFKESDLDTTIINLNTKQILRQYFDEDGVLQDNVTCEECNSIVYVLTSRGLYLFNGTPATLDYCNSETRRIRYIDSRKRAKKLAFCNHQVMF